MTSIISLDREATIRQTAKNIIEAKVVPPSQQQTLFRQLKQLDLSGLLLALIESHSIREQGVDCIEFYPVDMDSIAEN